VIDRTAPEQAIWRFDPLLIEGNLFRAVAWCGPELLSGQGQAEVSASEVKAGEARDGLARSGAAATVVGELPRGGPVSRAAARAASTRS
jgi:hypothetical protein